MMKDNLQAVAFLLIVLLQITNIVLLKRLGGKLDDQIALMRAHLPVPLSPESSQTRENRTDV